MPVRLVVYSSVLVAGQRLVGVGTLQGFADGKRAGVSDGALGDEPSAERNLADQLAGERAPAECRTDDGRDRRFLMRKPDFMAGCRGEPPR